MTDHATNNNTETDTETLAEFLHREWCNSSHHRSDWCRERVATLDTDKAASVLASDWLAARDADVAAQAKAEALAPVLALADEVTRWADGVANETSAKVGRWVVRRIRAAVAVPEPEEEQ